jgi:hypothetical protein
VPQDDEYQSGHGGFDPDAIVGPAVIRLDIPQKRPVWEYVMVDSWDLSVKQLNWLGGQGWQALCFVPGKRNSLLMIREKVDESESTAGAT